MEQRSTVVKRCQGFNFSWFYSVLLEQGKFLEVAFSSARNFFSFIKLEVKRFLPFCANPSAHVGGLPGG